MIRVRLKYLGIALLAFAFPASVWATNGYFSHGTSVAEKGMAGAGVAYSQDTLSAASNPAGMVWQGERLDVGAALFAPMRSYTVTGAPSGGGFNIGDGDQSIDSENESFIVPQYGQNWMLDSESSIGVSVYGNGGMNTEYKGGFALGGAPGTFGGGTAGVDLSQLFIATTYARKISDSASWGVSGIVAYQRFEATGLSNFGAFGFSSDPSNLTNNGHDSATGFGIRLGVQGEISPGITLGASFQPEIDMDEFDDYAGLFAEQGDFDIPSTLTLGLAWHISDTRVFLVDVQQINYEDVAAVSNTITPLTDGSCIGGVGDGCLGASNGAGFGWEDITVVKLGYEWKNDDTWTWRLGYSKTDQPIPESEVVFNILAPGVVEEHFTFGFTRALDNNSDFNFALMYAPNVSVTGTNTFEAPDQQTVEIEMDQYEIAASYSKRF